jgi:hypothetical protein
MTSFKLTFDDVQNVRKNKKNPNTKAHIVTGDIVEGVLEDSSNSADKKVLQGNDDRRD